MPFIPGIELSQRFWFEVVGPIVEEHVGFRDLAAGLLGAGSEVLGLDTEQSTDHSWGPRCVVFVPTGINAGALDAELERLLPVEFAGYSVRYARRDGYVPRHQVDVVHVHEWFTATIGFDPLQPIGAEDWLAAPTQLLASVVGGAVFHDGPGALTAGREALRWYPDDVWRYVLACQWRRLAQHEHLMGRTAQVGDELGASLIAARLARDIIRLGFLIERSWAPYDKWLGTAFKQLKIERTIGPELLAGVQPGTFPARQRHLMAALSGVAHSFNELQLVAQSDPSPRPFFGRPFLVLDCDRFANSLTATTTLATRGWAGAIDQWVDSVDLLSGEPAARPRLALPP